MRYWMSLSIAPSIIDLNELNGDLSLLLLRYNELYGVYEQNAFYADDKVTPPRDIKSHSPGLVVTPANGRSEDH